MDPEYWRARWREGRTGWHEAEGSAALRGELSRLGLGPGKRVLVPLCGKSHDLALLAATGAEVVGVELDESAAVAFFAEHGASATTTTSHGRVELAAAGVRIVCGDFFAETPERIGRFDAVYDRAAMVALPPVLRARYAETVRRLLAPGAAMLVVTFEHDAKGDEPPFSVPEADVRALYPGASLERLSERDVLSPGSGIATRGATRAIEAAFGLRFL